MWEDVECDLAHLIDGLVDLAEDNPCQLAAGRGRAQQNHFTWGHMQYSFLFLVKICTLLLKVNYCNKTCFYMHWLID